MVSNRQAWAGLSYAPPKSSMDWQRYAECGSVLDTDISDAQDSWFFPLSGNKHCEDWILAITTYCDYCPVRRQCEDYGQLHGCSGVWGGKVFSEQGDLLKQFVEWQDKRDHIGPPGEAA